MSNLTDLPNIGRKAAAQLRRLGAEAAFRKIRAIQPDACISKLCALEGAIQGIRWHGLSAPDQARLKAFYKSLK